MKTFPQKMTGPSLILSMLLVAGKTFGATTCFVSQPSSTPDVFDKLVAMVTIEESQNPIPQKIYANKDLVFLASNVNGQLSLDMAKNSEDGQFVSIYSVQHKADLSFGFNNEKKEAMGVTFHENQIFGFVSPDENHKLPSSLNGVRLLSSSPTIIAESGDRKIIGSMKMEENQLAIYDVNKDKTSYALMRLETKELATTMVLDVEHQYSFGCSVSKGQIK